MQGDTLVRTEESVGVPLVVDLDGTLIRADLLIETFFGLLTTRPLLALRAAAALRHGKAALKANLADHAVIDLHTLPFDEDVLAYVRAEKAKGRRVYLASASDRRLVDQVAGHLGLFDGAFGSDRAVNLAGGRKADALCRAFGERGFDYIGNHAVDIAVWDRCRAPIVANATPALLRQTRARYQGAHEIGALRTQAPSPRVLALRYVAFAAVATAANIGAQAASLALYGGGHALTLAMAVGTGVGLVIKYMLDKRWIFFDTRSSLRDHGTQFTLYTAMGVVTTALFWATELGFSAINPNLTFVGAATGLGVGYYVKYRLDRRFVFRAAAAAP